VEQKESTGLAAIAQQEETAELKWAINILLLKLGETDATPTELIPPYA